MHATSDGGLTRRSMLSHPLSRRPTRYATGRSVSHPLQATSPTRNRNETKASPYGEERYVPEPLRDALAPLDGRYRDQRVAGEESTQTIGSGRSWRVQRDALRSPRPPRHARCARRTAASAQSPSAERAQIVARIPRRLPQPVSSASSSASLCGTHDRASPLGHTPTRGLRARRLRFERKPPASSRRPCRPAPSRARPAPRRAAAVRRALHLRTASLKSSSARSAWPCANAARPEHHPSVHASRVVFPQL